MGRWPWPRRRIAEFIDRMSEAGAKLIKLPIMPKAVPNTDTYIEEMDYIVHAFVGAMQK